MAKDLPSAEVLRDLLEYQRDGRLVWRQDGPPCGKAVRAGCVAASFDNGKGYLRIYLQRRAVYVHRVVWKMFHGDDPQVIDHINGDRGDNRIENLRRATPAQNHRHSRRNTSKTGFKGVIKSSRGEKWDARIKVDGRQMHIGTFSTPEDAARAYDIESEKRHEAFSVTNASLGLL